MGRNERSRRHPADSVPGEEAGRVQNLLPAKIGRIFMRLLILGLAGLAVALPAAAASAAPKPDQREDTAAYYDRDGYYSGPTWRGTRRAHLLPQARRHRRPDRRRRRGRARRPRHRPPRRPHGRHGRRRRGRRRGRPRDRPQPLPVSGKGASRPQPLPIGRGGTGRPRFPRRGHIAPADETGCVLSIANTLA